MPRIESIVIHDGPQGAKGDPSVGVGDVALADGQIAINEGGAVVGRDFGTEVAATAAVGRVDPGATGAPGQFVTIGPSGPAWLDSPHFNVKHPRFGATGDGTTDDTAAIQAAIDAAFAAGGGIVFLPRGTYLIGTTLRVKSYVVLRGTGFQSILKLKNGANVNVVQSVATGAASAVTSVGVEHLAVDGNKANQTDGTTAYGITLQFTIDSWIDHVYVHDTVRSGIYLTGTRPRVERCFVTNIGLSNDIGRSGIVCANETSMDSVGSIIRGNSVLTTGEHGIKVYPTSHRSVISGNVVAGCGNHSIYVQASDNVTVSANTVTGGFSGILIGSNGQSSNYALVTGNTVTGASTSGIIINSSPNATVTGNVSTSNQGHGILFSASPGGTASGNTCVGNGATNAQGWAGILVYSSSNCAISGNTTKNNGNATNAEGIGTWDSGGATISKNVVVTGNRCFDDQGTKVQQYGIRTRNSADGWTIVGNDVTGNGTAGMSLVGTGNIVKQNTGYVTTNGGVASVANGGTITHGLATAPTTYSVTATAANRRIAVTAASATTLTISLTDGAGTAITTAENVAWRAEV